MNSKSIILLFGGVCGCFGLLFNAGAEVTKFTYQGRLLDHGNPAAGSYDMQFTLRDAVTNGNAVAGPVTRAPVEVTNDLFTVTLDFGSGVFNGTDRWLEIGVRTNGSLASYAILSPAQLLAAAPYAITAQNLNGRLNDGSLAGNYTNGVRMTNIFNQFAGSFRGNGANLSNLDSRSLTGALTVDSFGHVAVGTNDSGAALQVAGGARYLSPHLLSVIANNSMGISNLISPVNVFLVRTTAYVTAFYSGTLAILDVSDPQHPRLLGEAVDHALNPSSPFALDGASGLFVTNNIAYVTAENANTLNIIDVSNPQNPMKLAILTNGFGGFTNLNLPTGVLVKGTNCFVLGFLSSALTVIDVSNPANPRLLNQIVDATIVTNSPFTKLKYPYQMSLSGTNLYIAARGANAVTILDVSVPANPRLLAEVADASVDPSSPFTQLKGANWVEVVGNTAYVASGAFNSAAGSLTIMDVSDPRRPTKLSEVADASLQPGSPFTKLKGAWGVRVSQNIAFVTSFHGNAVTAIDVSDPANPALITELVNGVGGFNYLNFSEGLAISGDTLYVVADGSSALNLIGIHAQLGLEVDQFVGIGTATPQSALDVAGIVTAQGLNVSGAGAFASLSVQGSVVLDLAASNNGASSPGVIFGGGGEAIASKRTSTGNQYGLDFYTDYQPRMSIALNGSVGLGTGNPQGSLHVYSGNNPTVIRIQSTGTPGFGRLEFVSNPQGDVSEWRPGFIQSTDNGNKVSSIEVMRIVNGRVGIGTINPSALLQVGSATCNGLIWANASDRHAKENFEALDAQSVLAKVAALPLSRWNYKEDKASEHLGPMAQDFYAAFGLNGNDDTHITTVDEGGVALAAIQGLNQKLEQKETEITELKDKNQSLERRLEAVEKLIRNQNSN